MSDVLTKEAHEQELAANNEKHASDKKQMMEAHAKASDMANSQLQNMHSAMNVHEAEKASQGQVISELLQANVKLRAGTILLDKQGREGFAVRDNKINELVKEVANRDALIKELQTKLDVAHKVIEANTNLRVPAPADELCD